jgi:hypothetical protein
MRMGSKWILEIGWEGLEWIHLAQNRDWWRALVNTVMNPLVLVPQLVCYFVIYQTNMFDAP